MEKLKKYKGLMIVMSVTIILIVMISMTFNEREQITQAESLLGGAITPLQSISTSVGGGVSKGLSKKNSDTLRAENEQLNKEIIKLRDTVRTQENIINRKDFLEKEYKLLENTSYQLTKAEVVSKDAGNWVEKFVIDKGAKDGVEKGDIVIQGTEVEKDMIVEGLVGRVVGVGKSWANVVSIIDNSSSVSFIDSRTQDGGILRGNLEGNITGQLFDMKSVVNKGDKVFTSGLGGVFPKDIYIGDIDKVTKKDANLLVDIKINPAVNFNKLKDVFILKKD